MPVSFAPVVDGVKQGRHCFNRAKFGRYESEGIVFWPLLHLLHIVLIKPSVPFMGSLLREVLADEWMAIEAPCRVRRQNQPRL